MSATYEGTPCRKCGGTLRYYMQRPGRLRGPGQCVTCARAYAKEQQERRDRSQEPARIAWCKRRSIAASLAARHRPLGGLPALAGISKARLMARR